MTQHHEKLAGLLEELHRELSASPELDPSLRAALEKVVADIRRLQAAGVGGSQWPSRHDDQAAGEATASERRGWGAAEGPRTEAAFAGEAAPHHTLVERLREAADEFEGKHPNLVALIGSVIDALQGMGI
jgi:hypothetical protein